MPSKKVRPRSARGKRAERESTDVTAQPERGRRRSALLSPAFEAAVRAHCEPIIRERRMRLSKLREAPLDGLTDRDVPRVHARVLARIRLDQALWFGGDASDRAGVRARAEHIQRALAGVRKQDIRQRALARFVESVESMMLGDASGSLAHEARADLETRFAMSAIARVRGVSRAYAEALLEPTTAFYGGKRVRLPTAVAMDAACKIRSGRRGDFSRAVAMLARAFGDERADTRSARKSLTTSFRRAKARRHSPASG